MATVQELIAMGEGMGLKDEALREFIREQQTLEREERAKEREQEKLKLELQREQDRLKLEHEREQERERRTHELQKLEVQIKLEEMKQKAGSEEGDHDDGSVDAASAGKTRGPKMSSFDEKDDMDSYLHRFERYAELQGWKQETWAIYLAALLKGTALEVYARLPPDQAKDYDQLKAALLKRYNLTEDGYKQRFYESKAEKNESPQQYITRLNSYLLRWLELAAVPKTFDGLRCLIVRERFLATCAKPLEVFLRERALTDLDALAKAAEQFEAAHGGRPTQPKRDSVVESQERVPTSKDEVVARRSPIRRTCFNCGRVGHIAKNCFQKPKMGAMKTWQNRTNWEEHRENRYQSDQNQQTKGSMVRCRTHGRSDCNNCLLFSHTEPHTCSALNAETVKLECGCTLPVLAEACKLSAKVTMPVAAGKVFEKKVQVLRDTGCSTVVVKRELVPDDRLTGRTTVCMLIDGTARKTPIAMVELDTPFFKGTVEAVCMRQPMYDLIIGNIAGVLDKPELLVDGETVSANVAIEQTQAVVTRSQAQAVKKTKPLKVIEELGGEITPEQVAVLQKEDDTLRLWWQRAEGSQQEDGKVVRGTFIVKDGLLLRKHTEQSKVITQLVVPAPLRGKVLRMAHDCIMSGHQGIKRTYERVTAHFFWPGVHGDVVRYCKSCDICQRTIAKGRVTKVPLDQMPLIETPFQRVAIDLVGPIAPMTDGGNRYILTMVDYATRYPEAVPLKDIEAETVAEALVTMFTRVGIPEEVLSDQGSQFMSTVMKEVSRLLSLKQLATTPYHPMCNGLVERFNGTLKSMLKRMCSEKPKDWDRYIAALLFAYREVPQESLGFSPFELLYGRTVRGPMAILKDVWTNQELGSEVKTTYQYVLDLQERLQETCELARHELNKAQGRQKRYYDVKARDRELKPGDKVLLLLPTDHNKLLMQWKGPHDVIERMRGHNYRIQLPNRAKIFHVNMLKRYIERNVAEIERSEVLCAAVIDSGNDEDESMIEVSGQQNETHKNVHVNPEMDLKKQQEVRELIAEFADIFTDVPKVTTLGEHRIELTSSDPVRSKAYPLPYAMREAVDKEIDAMIALGIIEPSTAPYASPIVCVRKPDGSVRICIDYRKLNKITVFDPEPMNQMQEIFADLSASQYFSKFDFCKGYWQVPMRESDRDVTTFITHRGLFRFRVMPFGLVNAPATFSRIMRKLLGTLQMLSNYLDDVLAHTKGWDDHVAGLLKFFQRVRASNLALKPTKCFIGYTELTFLGHVLGRHGVSPTDDMVEKINRAPAPTTKKQLRSFLGLVGYYRSFVPNFAAIAVPLTDLTKKGLPNQLLWGDAQEHAFHALKKYVSNPPVLALPDVNKPFILQTDASSEGIGAILLQETDDVRHPVAFASKKLLPREQNYSTIEREALAIVWGIQKFQNYLYGQHFLLETDHCPLQFLNQAKFHNGRVMRWALLLQPYRFTVKAIKGSQNVGADFLSRNAC